MLEFILITAGISYGIVKSVLFERTRERISAMHLKKNAIHTKNYFWWSVYHITHCTLCMGFYASIPAYYLLYQKIDLLLIGYMFIGSISSFAIYLTIQKLK